MKMPTMNWPIIFMMGCIIAIIYMWMTNQLTPVVFTIFAILSAVALFRASRERKVFEFREIRERVYQEATDLQDKGELPSGTIRLMTETDLKELEIRSRNPEVVPDKWLVGVMVDGSPTKAFVFKASIYGNILGFSEIPTSWLVTSVPERTAISSIPKRIEEYEEYLIEKKRKEEEKRE